MKLDDRRRARRRCPRGVASWFNPTESSSATGGARSWRPDRPTGEVVDLPIPPLEESVASQYPGAARIGDHDRPWSTGGTERGGPPRIRHARRALRSHVVAARPSSGQRPGCPPAGASSGADPPREPHELRQSEHRSAPAAVPLRRFLVGGGQLQRADPLADTVPVALGTGSRSAGVTGTPASSKRSHVRQPTARGRSPAASRRAR